MKAPFLFIARTAALARSKEYLNPGDWFLLRSETNARREPRRLGVGLDAVVRRGDGIWWAVQESDDREYFILRRHEPFSPRGIFNPSIPYC